jgi:hypothetical protein
MPFDFIWRGSTGVWSASLTAAAGNHFGDKYNFSAPGNWIAREMGTNLPYLPTDRIPRAFADKFPTGGTFLAKDRVYIGSGITEALSPCLYGGWVTVAEAGTCGSCGALLRYSGEWGYWGVTAGSSGTSIYEQPIIDALFPGVAGSGVFLNRPTGYSNLALHSIFVRPDNYAFPYLGGGITGDILKWCRYNDGVSSDYQYTSCTSRKPHEPLKLMVQLLEITCSDQTYYANAISFNDSTLAVKDALNTLKTLVIPNTLDEDGTPELHTHRTKKKIDLVLRTTGGLSGPAQWVYPGGSPGTVQNASTIGSSSLPRIAISDWNPSYELVLDGGRWLSIGGKVDHDVTMAFSTNAAVNLLSDSRISRLIPNLHYKLGKMTFKNMNIADFVQAGANDYRNFPYYDIFTPPFYVVCPITFIDCGLARASLQYPASVYIETTRAEGYAEYPIYRTSYALSNPVNFYGCTFGIEIRDRIMTEHVPGSFPSYLTGLYYSPPTSFGQTSGWGNLMLTMIPRTYELFMEISAPEGQMRAQTIYGNKLPITRPSVYSTYTGITYPAFTMSRLEARDQYFTVNLGEEGTTRATKMNHLTIGGAAVQAALYDRDILHTPDPRYVPGSYWQELNYIPTRVNVNGTLVANYCNITDFCELVASPTLNSEDTQGVTSDIRIGEVRLFNFGTLNQSYNSNFKNWRIGSVTGGSSAAAGTVLGGIRFLDETGIVRSSGRVWNTQLYNGYNARQSSSGKTPPSAPELGLP